MRATCTVRVESSGLPRASASQEKAHILTQGGINSDVKKTRRRNRLPGSWGPGAQIGGGALDDYSELNLTLAEKVQRCGGR